MIPMRCMGDQPAKETCRYVSHRISMLCLTPVGGPIDPLWASWDGRPYIYRASGLIGGVKHSYVGSSVSSAGCQWSRLLQHAAQRNGFGGLISRVEEAGGSLEDITVEIVWRARSLFPTPRTVRAAEQSWMDRTAGEPGTVLMNARRAVSLS